MIGRLMNVHDPILAEGRRLLHVWRSRTRPPAECAAAVLLVIAFVLGSFASPARADEAPDVESTAVPEPTDWEAMGLLPYAGRLEAGLGASITLAAVGSTWFSPAPGATYFASCYGGGPCPDPSVTFAVGMVELPVLAAGLSGMLSWADGQARGPRTSFSRRARALYPIQAQQEARLTTARMARTRMTASALASGICPTWKVPLRAQATAARQAASQMTNGRCCSGFNV